MNLCGILLWFSNVFGNNSQKIFFHYMAPDTDKHRTVKEKSSTNFYSQ